VRLVGLVCALAACRSTPGSAPAAPSPAALPPTASAALASASPALSAPGPSNRAAARPLDEAAIQLDAQLLRMADDRRADLALLDRLLEQPLRTVDDSARRVRVVLLLGQLRERARYPTLRTLLASADTALAATAAFALGLARDTASAAALGSALERSAHGVAAEAAWALGQLGEPARPWLEAALRQLARTPGDPVPDGRATSPLNVGRGERFMPDDSAAALRAVAVARATAALRPVPVALLEPLLQSGSPDVAEAAAWALARTRAPDGARALLAQATHRAPEVRAQVAAGLSRAAVGDSLAGDARAALLALAGDDALPVRVLAVRALATLLGPLDTLADAATVERRALLDALRDPARPVRVTAAEGIAPILGGAPNAWQAALAGDTTYPVQRALFDAAARRGVLSDSMRRAWQHHTDPWRRVAALEATAPDSAAPLASVAWAWDDPASRVRCAAISRMTPFAARTDVRDALRGRTRDTAPAVRAAALGVLAGRGPVADDVDHALDAARRPVVSIADEAARVAAVRVLAAAWRRDSLRWTGEQRASAAALTLPRDAALARAVRDVTPWREAADARLADAFADDAFYRTRAREAYHRETSAPQLAILHTARGVITLELLVREAPLTVHNFVTLARAGWFDDTRFHRVIAGFVAQDGDPTGTGSGGPGYSIRDELNRHRYARGAVGMALSGPDTGGSQYFLTLTPQPHLDGGYTVFARVTDGFEVMDGLLLGDRLLRVEVP
jgi:cyclophilin family peptidyl-prolyl cis-trans isomerase/HEAT repeat protein